MNSRFFDVLFFYPVSSLIVVCLFSLLNWYEGKISGNANIFLETAKNYFFFLSIGLIYHLIERGSFYKNCFQYRKKGDLFPPTYIFSKKSEKILKEGKLAVISIQKNHEEVGLDPSRSDLVQYPKSWIDGVIRKIDQVEQAITHGWSYEALGTDPKSFMALTVKFYRNSLPFKVENVRKRIEQKDFKGVETCILSKSGSGLSLSSRSNLHQDLREVIDLIKKYSFDLEEFGVKSNEAREWEKLLKQEEQMEKTYNIPL